MGGFFNVDNPIFRGLGKLFDVMMLSFLWLLCCIPIITIGAATSALYYTTVKVIRRDCGYLSKEFFKAFKMNFKVGTISWLIIFAISVILAINIRIMGVITIPGGQVLTYIFYVMAVFLCFMQVYIPAALSRFTVGVIKLFKMSVLLAIKHLPSTILMVFIVAVTGVLFIVFIPSVFFSPAAAAWLISLLMERIFKKYMPAPEEGSLEEEAWYYM